MNLSDDDTPAETPTATAGRAPDAAHADSPADADSLAHADSPAHDALDDTLPAPLKRDFIQLLMQSPHRLYLYWTFARDPHDTLREAFGELADGYTLSVRLVKVESGEEFLLDAPREHAQWFEVFPRHVYRAEVGFHSPGRPFVRLLSSNTLTTPPDRASHLSDTEQEFQLGAGDLTRLLGGAGYERYAHALADVEASGIININEQQGGAAGTAERLGERLSREAAEEYPHR